MKQVVQSFKTGRVTIEDVPRPMLRPGCVLVRNAASLISTGTEGTMVKLGKKSLIGKARARPEQVQKVLRAVRTEGLLSTAHAVSRSLDLPVPLGYSCAGMVDEIAAGIGDLEPGDRVACGGGGMAFHAGYVVIPRKLCAKLPANVTFDQAAFTTMGAIAMQSVRIAEARLGENVAVIGLGLVGMLTAQILRAAGCRVFGVDVNRQRVKWVEEQGFCEAAPRHADNLHERLKQFTAGQGMDTVIITAAVPNNDPVALAGEICRHKGRVVVVGRTVMTAPRDTYLMKELELRTSLAYGPGTGDANYEIAGNDYPIAYVRWTENRNMQCFLELVADGKIDVDRLMSHRFPVENAVEAFDVVTRPASTAIGVVLLYGDHEAATTIPCAPHAVAARPARRIKTPLRIGIIGAGSFATNTMVPLLARRGDVRLEAVASATGIKAAALAKKYGIAACASDAQTMVDSPDVDCVFIFTRHGTHAQLAEQALLAGKHVFVEKPLALTEQQLEAVRQAQQRSGRVLMCGFNRRFSPLAVHMKRLFADRVQPIVVDFRGNVGYRPADHWLHDPHDGGGVIVGEACHYIDFCRWLVDAEITSVAAACIGGGDTGLVREDNAAISLGFADGSLAHVLYVSNGAVALGRERCEAHAEGKSAVWTDFRSVRTVRGLQLARTRRNRLLVSKGYREELEAFLKAARADTGRAIDWLDAQFDASRASLVAAAQIRSAVGQSAIDEEARAA